MKIETNIDGYWVFLCILALALMMPAMCSSPDSTPTKSKLDMKHEKELLQMQHEHELRLKQLQIDSICIENNLD